MIDLIITVALFAVAAGFFIAAARIVRRMNLRQLPRVTEWQARENCRPLSNAISRHPERGLGPVPVARDHRDPDRA
jgi:hypothetical protein